MISPLPPTAANMRREAVALRAKLMGASAPEISERAAVLHVLREVGPVGMAFVSEACWHGSTPRWSYPLLLSAGSRGLVVVRGGLYWVTDAGRVALAGYEASL